MAGDVDVIALRSFVVSARLGSLSRAASELGIAQPAVSQHLRRLEAAIGSALFDRTTRGVTLTPTGAVALRYAQRILALAADLQGLKPPGTAAARFRIGLLEHAAASGLAGLLADFASVHPGVVLDVVIADSSALRGHLDEGEIDLALGDPSVMGSVAGGTRRRAAFSLAWAAHPTIQIRHGPVPLVLFRAPCAWRDSVLETLAAANQPWRLAFEASSLAAVQAAVQAGLGIGALLPGTMQPGMLPLESTKDLGLPPAPSVELGLYRHPRVASGPVLARLEELVWGTLG